MEQIELSQAHLNLQTLQEQPDISKLRAIQYPNTFESDVKIRDKDQENVPELNFHDYSPTDGGYGWAVVFGAFLVNFVFFGQTFAWGVFQDLYLNVVYKGQTSELAVSFAGTLGTGVMLSLGLFLEPMIRVIGVRCTMAIGTILLSMSLVLASFANQLWVVCLTQGVLFGIGGTLVFFPAIGVPAQWFDKLRGFATGLSVCGTGIGGLALAPLMQLFIDLYGFRNCLRIMAGISFVLLLLSTLLIRERLPSHQSKKRKPIFNKNVLNKQMIVLLCSGFVVPFAYLVPFFLLPQYAEYIGLSPNTAAVYAGLMSGFNALGRIVFGYGADKLGRVTILSLCTVISGLACTLLWAFARTPGLLFLFIVLYGFFGGGFVALFPTCAVEIVGIENFPNALGLLYLSDVPGDLLGPPLAGALLDMTFPNTNYLPAIQFAGAMSLIASGFMIWLRVMRSEGKGLFAKV